MHVYYKALLRYSPLALATLLGDVFVVPHVVTGLKDQYQAGDANLATFVLCAFIVAAIVWYFNWFVYVQVVTHLFKVAVEEFFPDAFEATLWASPRPHQHPLWKDRRQVISLHWQYQRSTPAVQETFVQLLDDSGDELTLDLYRLAREVATPALVAA